jgi:F-type H+-transporting ATPase subunit b
MPLNISWQQILLHLFNFAILFAILYFLLYKPVKDFMEQRQQHYRDMDQQVKHRLSEAESAKSNYERKLAAADAEIREKKTQAQTELTQSTEAQLQMAQTEAAQIIAKAKAEAKAQREEIVNGAQNEITEMAVKVVERMVLPSTSDAFDKFLNSVEGSDTDE